MWDKICGIYSLFSFYCCNFAPINEASCNGFVMYTFISRNRDKEKNMNKSTETNIVNEMNIGYNGGVGMVGGIIVATPYGQGV